MNRLTLRRQHIEKWILEAANRVKQSLHDPMIIEQKTSRTDLVTNIDKETEQFLTQKIKEQYPGERVLGEESIGHDINESDGIIWIIDPIDGTLNFVKQKSNFAIMIAVYENGIGLIGCIYDVMQDKMYSAIKDHGVFCNQRQLPQVEDIPLKEGLVALSTHMVTGKKHEKMIEIIQASSGLRMIGSAGLETVFAASGKLVAYISLSLAPWDIAAGKVIAEEAGLIYTQLNGEPIAFLKPNAVIVATPSAYHELRERL